MAHNEIPHLLGNPYVGWSPRPAKNGQPSICYGQCSLNLGGRKVGAAMKRLPQLEYGMKSKEQILQKWDPVSRSLVNIHFREPIPILSNLRLTITTPEYTLDPASPGGYYYESGYSLSFDSTLFNKQLGYAVYKVGSPDVLIFNEIISSNVRTINPRGATGIFSQSYYAVLTFEDTVVRSSVVQIPPVNVGFNTSTSLIYEGVDEDPAYSLRQVFSVPYTLTPSSTAVAVLYDDFLGAVVSTYDINDLTLTTLTNSVILQADAAKIFFIFNAVSGRSYHAIITPYGCPPTSTPSLTYIPRINSASLTPHDAIVSPVARERYFTVTWSLTRPASVIIKLYSVMGMSPPYTGAIQVVSIPTSSAGPYNINAIDAGNYIVGITVDLPGAVEFRTTSLVNIN